MVAFLYIYLLFHNKGVDEMQEELSLQSLKRMIEAKADKEHIHRIAGSIESALSLNGVSYDKFVRNDLKDQTIKSYHDLVTLALESQNTIVSLKAGNNRARLEIDNKNLDTDNLTISGANNSDLIMKVIGQLFVNDSRVLTLNDRNEISGVDFSDLNINGKGILVDRNQPVSATTGTVWGEVIDEDLVIEDNGESSNHLYTIPVGSIIQTLSNVIPNGYLKLDGRLVSRETYESLWRFAKARAVIIDDEDWLSLS